MHYRSDIDGLRAVAVVSVMLYHFGVPGFPGGFVGVDIFFVISGYLITRLIFDELNAGTFSLLSFYNRRIRRIVPAMLLVIVLSMLAGAVLLLPGDYAALGTSAAYSAAGLANIYFLNHTGYFDRSAEMLPLLHLWSLAVEEQFYVVWPILLAGVLTIARKRRDLFIFTLVLLLVSLGLSIYQTTVAPKSAFFLAHLRTWELATGALLVFLPPIRKCAHRLLDEAPAIGGAILIIGSTCYFATRLPFPGIGAIPACIGTALIVWPREGASSVGCLLAASPLRFTGLISYSLYLWHWPLLVFYRHYAQVLTAADVAGLAIASFALASLSWRYVEQPWRRASIAPPKVIGLGIGGMSLAAVAGLALANAGGFPNRLSPKDFELSSLERMWEWKCPQYVVLTRRYCVFGADWESAAHRAVLWGDSHAEHFAPLLQPFAERKNVAVLLYRECAAVIEDGVINFNHPTISTYSTNCTVGRRRALNLLQSDPRIAHVILASAWSTAVTRLWRPGEPRPKDRYEATALLAEGFDRLAGKIEARERDIVLIGEMPRWTRDPVPCALASQSGFILRRPCPDNLLSISQDAFERGLGPTYRTLRAATTGREDWSAILPGDAVCKTGRCISRIGGEFLYRDAGHLRRNLPESTRRALGELIGLDRIF